MKTLKQLSILYFILLASFTLLITAAFCIPTSAVRENVEESAVQIERDGLWYKPFGFYLFQIDNMTDCQMLRINATADSSRPVWAAMMAEQYDNATDTLHPYYEVTSSTKAIARNGRRATDRYTDYARYWHGYQLFLRPLLTLFSYHAILLINYFLLSLLIIFTIYAAYRVLGKVYAATLAASLVLTNVFIVPLALQFSTCYYIALLAMLLFLAKPERATDTTFCINTFFIVGAVTVYMDFLTTPLLTLGMPLVVICAISARRNAANQLQKIMRYSISWLAGYALLWISKWAIGSMLTGQNIFLSAMNNAKLRVGNTIVFGGKEMPMSDFLDAVFGKLCSAVGVWSIAAAVAIAAILTILYIYNHRRETRLCGWLLVIAAMPAVWFAVMKNHSLQHIFFTWRDFVLTLWCLMLYICKTLGKTRRI